MRKASIFNVTSVALGLAFLYLPIAAQLRRLDPAVEDAALGEAHRAAERRALTAL